MIHSSFLHAYMLSHLQLGFYLLFFSQKFGVIFYTSLPFHTLSLILVFHLNITLLPPFHQYYTELPIAYWKAYHSCSHSFLAGMDYNPQNMPWHPGTLRGPSVKVCLREFSMDYF